MGRALTPDGGRRTGALGTGHTPLWRLTYRQAVVRIWSDGMRPARSRQPRDGDDDGDGAPGPEPGSRAPAAATSENVRAAHRPSRRQQIIDAAIRVFGAEGVTTTTMADIAHECGAVAASMYYHFPNKEAVLTAAMEQIGAEIIVAQRRTHETAEGRDLGPRVRGVFHWSRDNPDKARLFYLWSVGVSPQIEELRRRFVEERIHRATRYQRRRDRTRQDVYNRQLAARTAIDLAMAVSVAWLTGDVFDPATTADDVADALSEALVRILGN